MSVKEVKSGILYKEYLLEIPYEEINQIIDSKIKEILPTVSLPGFRKGKAPIGIVRKKYENNVLSESVEKLVQNKTRDLLKEKKLKAFTQPKIDLKKYEKNEPIEVNIKVDLEPEINLYDFRNLQLNKYEINLEKKIIEENYDDFIKSQKKYKEVEKDREILKSDKIIINLSTEEEGVPSFLKSQKNLPLIIDSEYEILPSIGKKILEKKLKKGNFTNLNLDISKTAKLDTKKLINFKIEIIKIEEQVKFVIDKEFLDNNGLKNEGELKTNIEKSLKSQYINGIKQIQKKELMDELDKQHKFDLPQGILDQELKDITHRLENAKKDGTLDEDDKKLGENDLKKRYEKISKRRVKLAILLQFIAKENKITVDEKELSNSMMEYASQYPGQEKQILDYFKNNPTSIESIRGPILEEKVIDHIMSKAKIKNFSITKDQYEKLEKKVFEVH